MRSTMSSQNPNHKGDHTYISQAPSFFKQSGCKVWVPFGLVMSQDVFQLCMDQFLWCHRGSARQKSPSPDESCRPVRVDVEQLKVCDKNSLNQVLWHDLWQAWRTSWPWQGDCYQTDQPTYRQDCTPRVPWHGDRPTSVPLFPTYHNTWQI